MVVIGVLELEKGQLYLSVEKGALDWKLDCMNICKKSTLRCLVEGRVSVPLLTSSLYIQDCLKVCRRPWNCLNIMNLSFPKISMLI